MLSEISLMFFFPLPTRSPPRDESSGFFWVLQSLSRCWFDDPWTFGFVRQPLSFPLSLFCSPFSATVLQLWSFMTANSPLSLIYLRSSTSQAQMMSDSMFKRVHRYLFQSAMFSVGFAVDAIELLCTVFFALLTGSFSSNKKKLDSLPFSALYAAAALFSSTWN